MPIREFALFLLICLVFAVNNIITKVVVADLHVPPFFYAAGRYAVVMLALLPMLWPIPRPRTRVIFGALLLGFGAFGLYVLAMKSVGASSAAVISLSQAPIGTFLAIVILGEKLTAQRLIGASLTLIGLAAVIYNPGDFHASVGLWIVVASSLCAAMGAVVCKQLADVPPLRFMAWNGLVCLAAFLPTSFLLEHNQVEAALNGGWRLIGALLFLGLVVSIFAHTLYIRLLQKHDANLMAPLSLLMPLMTVVLGVVWLGDPLSLQMIIGTLLALGGVLVLSYHSKSKLEMVLD